MGVNTYDLGGGIFRWKPGAVDEHGELRPEVAGAMALALSAARQGEGLDPPENENECEDGLAPAPVAAELHCFGLDAWLNLCDERPPYAFKANCSGQELASRVIAPWVAEGSWAAYETEQEAWAIVWTGDDVLVLDMVPNVAGSGVVLLDPAAADALESEVR